ncbi:MAG: transcriptional repressor [Actinomycetota bacterium]|nr:transcriptional repressor [Actinomycetota bacterium]
MTVAPGTTPIEAPDLESATDSLRAQGMRISTARRLLLEALYEATEPLSAEHLGARVGGAADVASVYRNLEAFQKFGLVRHVHLGHGPGLYARTGLGPREYLICDACGTHRSVDPAELDELRDLVRSRFGYEARFTHFPIAGLCPSCARSDRRHEEDEGG